MRSSVLALFSSLVAASMANPVALNSRDVDCPHPTSYTITDYTYAAPAGSEASLSFNLKSTWNATTADVITADSTETGITCQGNSGADGTWSTYEFGCSSGRDNFYFDFASAPGSNSYMLIHEWKCNDASWIAKTLTTITPDAETVTPQNVCSSCASPTHCTSVCI